MIETQELRAMVEQMVYDLFMLGVIKTETLPETTIDHLTNTAIINLRDNEVIVY